MFNAGAPAFLGCPSTSTALNRDAETGANPQIGCGLVNMQSQRSPNKQRAKAAQRLPPATGTKATPQKCRAASA